jgi:hypothetical protein
MPSYLARVASVDGAVDALVIVAPVAVRSRWVVDGDGGAGFGAALGGVVAATCGTLVVVEAACGGAVIVGFDAANVVAGTRGGIVVVVIGVPDVLTICGFVAFGGEDAAGPVGVTPAFRFVAVTAEACAFVVVATPTFRFVTVTADAADVVAG